jgi:hypothetical protein
MGFFWNHFYVGKVGFRFLVGSSQVGGRSGMTKPAPERHYESAQEECQRRVRELYQLADKMGLRLTVTVKKKPAVAPNSGAMAGLPASAQSATKAGKPAEADSPRRREPGEN